MSVEECERCIEGCDITVCLDCGEEYTNPCARHRAAGHVPSTDAFDDGSGCSSCCLACHGAPFATRGHAVIGPCERCGAIAELTELPTGPDWADNQLLCQPCAHIDPANPTGAAA